MNNRGTLINIVLLTSVILLSGLTPVAAKDAMSELPPLSTGLIRFSVAGLLLLVTWLLRRDPAAPTERPIPRSDYARFVLAALLCVPANQAFFLTGVRNANASHAGLFYALNPVIVYLLTLVVGGAARSLRMAAAAVIAFAGAAVIGLDGLLSAGGGTFVTGDVQLFLAVFSWSLYVVVAQPLNERYGSVRSLMIMMLLGALLYAPVWLIDGRQFDLLRAGPQALVGFIYLAVLTSYLNYLLIFVAMARIDMNRLSVAVNAAPIVSVLAAWLLRDEPITGWLAAGAALIIAAITLANWDKLRSLRRAV
jgi:drug/metabolite transporter (DMT)-like permease